MADVSSGPLMYSEDVIERSITMPNQSSTRPHDPIGKVFWWSAIGGMLLAGGAACVFIASFLPMHEELRGAVGISGTIACAIGGGLLAPMVIASRLR